MRWVKDVVIAEKAGTLEAIMIFDMTGENETSSAEQTEQSADDKSIICKICKAVITRQEDRVSIQGQHCHTCTNPADIIYTIGCFQAALGCCQIGPTSFEHTWFQGYQWQMSVCASCGEHLGWCFNSIDCFYGLILDRLLPQQ